MLGVTPNPSIIHSHCLQVPRKPHYVAVSPASAVSPLHSGDGACTKRAQSRPSSSSSVSDVCGLPTCLRHAAQQAGSTHIPSALAGQELCLSKLFMLNMLLPPHSVPTICSSKTVCFKLIPCSMSILNIIKDF